MLARAACSDGPYMSGESCWRVYTRPSLLGWIDLRASGSPNDYIRKMMVQEPWYPFIADCMSQGGSGEECISVLPDHIRQLYVLHEQNSSLGVWNINTNFPWRQQVNACLMNGGTDRQCIEKLPPDMLKFWKSGNRKQLNGDEVSYSKFQRVNVPQCSKIGSKQRTSH